MTTLAFDLDPADTVVLALLMPPAITNLPVHIGNVADSDDNTKTISAPLPYVLYNSSMGFVPVDSTRLGGRGGRVPTFSTTFAHNNLRGAKAVGAALLGLLDGAVVTVDGKACRICIDAPDRDGFIARDQVWTRPGGLPLFTGVLPWYVL